MVPLTVFTTYGIVTETTGGRFGGLPRHAGGDGVHRPLVCADGRRLPGGGFGVCLFAEVLRGAARLPGRLVAAAGLFVPADDQLPRHRHLPERSHSCDTGLGHHPGHHRHRDGAEHRRHCLGGQSQLPDYRGAGGLHRRLRGAGLRHAVRERHRGPDGAADRRRQRDEVQPGNGRCRDLCLSFLGFDAVSTLSEEAKDPAAYLPRS